MNISRENLLRTLVLNEVSDDYENFEKIENACRISASKCGLVVGAEDVVHALFCLIRRGLIRGFVLTGHELPREIEGVPDRVDINRIYFFQTESGKEAHETGFWPLDDQGLLLPDVSIA